MNLSPYIRLRPILPLLLLLPLLSAYDTPMQDVDSNSGDPHPSDPSLTAPHAYLSSPSCFLDFNVLRWEEGRYSPCYKLTELLTVGEAQAAEYMFTLVRRHLLSDIFNLSPGDLLTFIDPVAAHHFEHPENGSNPPHPPILPCVAPRPETGRCIPPDTFAYPLHPARPYLTVPYNTTTVIPQQTPPSSSSSSSSSSHSRGNRGAPHLEGTGPTLATLGSVPNAVLRNAVHTRTTFPSSSPHAPAHRSHGVCAAALFVLNGTAMGEGAMGGGLDYEKMVHVLQGVVDVVQALVSSFQLQYQKLRRSPTAGVVREMESWKPQAFLNQQVETWQRLVEGARGDPSAELETVLRFYETQHGEKLEAVHRWEQQMLIESMQPGVRASYCSPAQTLRSSEDEDVMMGEGLSMSASYEAPPSSSFVGDIAYHESSEWRSLKAEQEGLRAVLEELQRVRTRLVQLPMGEQPEVLGARWSVIRRILLSYLQHRETLLRFASTQKGNREYAHLQLEGLDAPLTAFRQLLVREVSSVRMGCGIEEAERVLTFICECNTKAGFTQLAAEEAAQGVPVRLPVFTEKEKGEEEEDSSSSLMDSRKRRRSGKQEEEESESEDSEEDSDSPLVSSPPTKRARGEKETKRGRGRGRGTRGGRGGSRGKKASEETGDKNSRKRKASGSSIKDDTSVSATKTTSKKAGSQKKSGKAQEEVITTRSTRSRTRQAAAEEEESLGSMDRKGGKQEQPKKRARKG